MIESIFYVGIVTLTLLFIFVMLPAFFPERFKHLKGKYDNE